MRSSFVVASIVMGLAVAVPVAGCKKHPAKGDSPKPSPAPSAKEATNDKPTRTRAPIPFGQRPPKPDKVVAPHIPDLPELAKQEKAPPPPKVPAGEYACGVSHSGESDYPLMCLEDKDHEKNEKTARVLIPYGHFRDKRAPLPKVVDHREEATESEVRNQGSAGTCTSFATAAAIDHSVTRWSGIPAHVSTMELWGRYHQTNLADALIASVGQTFAPEDLWPYDSKTAWVWRDCPKGGGGGKATEAPCGQPVDRAKLAELEKKPIVVVEQVEWLPKDFELIKHKIAGGQDPIFAIKLPRHFKPVGKPGERYIPDYKEEMGGHALSLAGYALGDKGDNYYLIHNSWGPNWGDGGYVWIHETTLVKHMMNGFGVVDARPIKGAKAHREGKTCPSGRAPDSLTGTCEAECKDGSPMHNGVCPDPSDCPNGYVNLFGECIAAAPTDSSKDEKTGISWKCGIGGCAWTLPKSVGKCEKEPCILSCPAPSFRAAKDDHGLTCVE